MMLSEQSSSAGALHQRGDMLPAVLHVARKALWRCYGLWKHVFWQWPSPMSSVFALLVLESFTSTREIPLARLRRRGTYRLLWRGVCWSLPQPSILANMEVVSPARAGREPLRSWRGIGLHRVFLLANCGELANRRHGHRYAHCGE